MISDHDQNSESFLRLKTDYGNLKRSDKKKDKLAYKIYNIYLDNIKDVYV